MQKPLVSLVSPCFNTGRYIHRLLESVLRQTYPNIEMIVVDDGSTDDSKDVVTRFIPLFAEKGFLLKYVYQENSGQSVAIQNALQYVNGKYFAWPDSDDFYSVDNAIERMVTALENASDEVAIVIGQIDYLDESLLRKVKETKFNNKNLTKKQAFENCLYIQNDFYFCAGACIINYQKLLKSAIWPMYTEKNAGQNWQLLLPIFWNYRCLFISDNLYSVLIRSSSHSRGQYTGYKKLITRYTAHLNTILETLDKIKDIPDEDRKNYKDQIRYKYLKIFQKLAFQYGNVSEYDFYCEQLETNKRSSHLFKLLVHWRLSKLAWIFFEIASKIKRKMHL